MSCRELAPGVGAPWLRLALGPWAASLPSLLIPLAPLLQWSGLRAGVSCEGTDWELALGPPSESGFLFFPLLFPWAAGTFQPRVALAIWHGTWRHGAGWSDSNFRHLGPHGTWTVEVVTLGSNSGCSGCYVT